MAASDRLWRCPQCGQEQLQPKMVKSVAHPCRKARKGHLGHSLLVLVEKENS